MKSYPLRCLSLSLFLPIFFSTVSLAADIENGERIFSANCSACHAGGNNVIIPEKTLKKEALEANGMNSVDAITYQVTNGKNAMPAFGGRLDDGDIEDVANYVLSQSEKGWE
jgi:cytochrome c6